MSKFLLFLFFLCMPCVELFFLFRSEACVRFFSFSFFLLTCCLSLELSFFLFVLSFVLGALRRHFFFLFPTPGVPHFFLSLELSFFFFPSFLSSWGHMSTFFSFFFLLLECRIFLVFGVNCFFFFFFVVSFAFSLSPLSPGLVVRN